MNISAVENNKTNIKYNIVKKAPAPSFKGGTAVLDYLVTNPVWGATATDVTSMGGPRTVIDTCNRGAGAGFETGFREFSSTANDASVGAYGLLAGTILAGMLSPMGLKDPQRIFASNESLDLHNAKWNANGSNLDNFINDYVESLHGFNPDKAGADSKGYVKIADEHKQALKDDLKALTDKTLSKKDRKTVFKRVQTRILEAVGSDSQLMLKHGDKSIEASSQTMVDDFYRLTKAFGEKNASTTSEKLVSRIKTFGKSRALLGLGTAMALSASFQPLNVWMTKKRTGTDGFAGMPDRQKDNSVSFKIQKAVSAAAMASIALLTMKAKPSQLMDRIMFKGSIPTIDQIKALFAVTICSRMLAARDKDELGETNRKDILGYLNWLIIGNLINKGFLMKFQDKSNPVVRMSEEVKNKKGIKGAIAKFFSSNVASRREVLVEGMVKEGKSAIKPNGVAKTITEMMKELPKNSVARKNIKLLNIGQLVNYAYTIAVLGYGLPKMNIAITNSKQKKRAAQKEQMMKDKVQTVNNQDFVDKTSGYESFLSFKGNLQK